MRLGFGHSAVMTPEALHPETSSPAKSQPIFWYRSRLDPTTFKELHQRSDFKAWVQTLGYLGLLLLLGFSAFYSSRHFPWYATVGIVFLYGTCFSFQVNAIHELGHNTVFRTKFWNGFFVRIFSFLAIVNFERFMTSHARHHRYTLHAPDDLEVVLPMKIMRRQFFRTGFIFPVKAWWNLKDVCRLACNRFGGEWELALFPEGSDARRAAVNWSRTMLVGHACILTVSLCFHLWMLPILTTFGSCYGEWLFFLCNNTQHIGLQDDVPDFRLCCRTFTLHPFLRFLYWQMNYHIEHHMYAAVPCYHLPRLHELIEHDLPPSADGLFAVWHEIAAIQEIQELQPDYQHEALLPSHPGQV